MWVKLLLGAVGLLAWAMAAVAIWIGLESRDTALRLGNLPRLDADAVEEAPVGQEGVVEGHLAPDHVTAFRNFVLYEQSRFEGYGVPREGIDGHRVREPRWRTEARVLPPLRVQTGTGEVRAVGPYALTLRGADPSWLSTEGLEPGVTQRTSGLQPGQPVTLVGEVAVDGSGRALRAAQVISGPWAEARAGACSGAHFGLIAGAVLGLVGAVLLTLAVVLG